MATAVGAGLFFGVWQPETPEAVTPNETKVTPLPTMSGPGEESIEEWIVVHVAGEVVHPGLVRVRAPARVGDVIGAAGGATAEARLGEINLAASVSDGDRVVVPGPGIGAGQGEVWVDRVTESSDKVHLNRATVAELERVPGLGPVLAARIVDHRSVNGPFREVEGLLDVSGIGEKKLAGIREYVVLP